MSGEQGTIRAIRVICAENGLQDWPQRGAEGTKRRRRLKPLISAHRRSSRTAECPRNTRNTRKAEPGRLAAKRRKKGERRSDFFTEFTEPCHRGRRRLKAKTAKCRERSVDPRNPRETLGRLLRIIFLPTKSAYPKRPFRGGRKIPRAGRFCIPRKETGSLHKERVQQQVSSKKHPGADHPEILSASLRLRMIFLARGHFIGRAGRGISFRPAATDSPSRSCKYRHRAATSWLNSAEMASLIL